jgi:hypothetical protein
MGKHKKPAHNRKAKGVPRLSSGRLSRSDDAKRIERVLVQKQYEQTERETLAPALETRIRLHGVKATDALDQYAGSAVGRLSLMGEKHGGISKKQMAAAVAWLEERAQYVAAIAAPADARAFDPSRTPGRTNAESPERDLEVMERHRKARDAVHAAQAALGLKSNLWAALNIIVEQDRDMPHLVGDLREVLNALGRHYRIIPMGSKKAA